MAHFRPHPLPFSVATDLTTSVEVGPQQQHRLWERDLRRRRIGVLDVDLEPTWGVVQDMTYIQYMYHICVYVICIYIYIYVYIYM